MLARFVGLALAVETLLVCLEGVIPACARFLPLGGTHLAQLGAVLGMAIVATHVLDAAHKS